MAVIQATYTDSRDAERAAAALREGGFSGAKVGTSNGDIGDVIGLGTTDLNLRVIILVGSVLAGAVALGAVCGLLGMFSMDTPDIRGQGNIYSIGPALTSLVSFLFGGIAVGGIGGLICGMFGAEMVSKMIHKIVADGDAPRRPMISVPVNNKREEDTAVVILREVGPPFELGVR